MAHSFITAPANSQYRSTVVFSFITKISIRLGCFFNSSTKEKFLSPSRVRARAVDDILYIILVLYIRWDWFPLATNIGFRWLPTWCSSATNDWFPSATDIGFLRLPTIGSLRLPTIGSLRLPTTVILARGALRSITSIRPAAISRFRVATRCLRENPVSSHSSDVDTFVSPSLKASPLLTRTPLNVDCSSSTQYR